MADRNPNADIEDQARELIASLICYDHRRTQAGGDGYYKQDVARVAEVLRRAREGVGRELKSKVMARLSSNEAAGELSESAINQQGYRDRIDEDERFFSWLAPYLPERTE